jgi:hypothetical protein
MYIPEAVDNFAGNGHRKSSAANIFFLKYICYKSP